MIPWSETQTGNKVRFFRSDGDWEAKEVKNELTRLGIEHRLTTTDTPTSNAIAERMGGVIGEKAGSMLFEARLPEVMGGEMLITACYLYNRTPRETKEGVWKTPYELFYGKKPMLHFLKAIGSKCWVRLPVHKFHKYQKRSAEGVMVGYDNEKRAYRIWCPFYKEFYTSRDVKFDETRRGYHGGTNYREEQSRPDDWNVVVWSNASSFKPMSTVKQPQISGGGQTSTQFRKMQISKSARNAQPAQKIRQERQTGELDTGADENAQQNDFGGDEISHSDAGESTWGGVQQDDNRYYGSDALGNVSKMPEVQKSNFQDRSFRINGDTKKSFSDQKHGPAEISPRRNDAGGNEYDQHDAQAKGNDKKMSPMARTHGMAPQSDEKDQKSMSGLRGGTDLQRQDSDGVPPVRRSGRQIVPTLRGLESLANVGYQDDFHFCGLSSVTISDAQATADPVWRASRDSEINSLRSLNSFRVVKREAGMKVIPTRWVY
jgi:hypothetical protein